MLQACPLVISRQLKRGGSLLLAAKVIVLSRLLHKTLSKPSDVPPIVDKLRDQLGSLRRRLLARIDRQLASTEVEVSSHVEAMCAFSLATSSTPTDVLKHFQSVRLEAIKSQFEEKVDVHDHILQALKLCVQTLQQAQVIFPALLSQALSKLKGNSLIRNTDVQGVLELNLSIHERWVAEEVRNYTPWPRHDELQKPEAERLMKAWAKQAMASTVKGMGGALANLKDLRSVVKLRQEMVEVWLASSKRAPGLDPARVLDELRETLNDRITALIKQTATGVRTLVDGMYEAIHEWSPAAHVRTSLWDGSLTSADISDGATVFKKAVINANRGCNKPILDLVSIYKTWTDSVVEIRQIIKEIRDIRWDDDLDVDEDDDLGLDSRQSLLSEDDPLVLEEALEEALSKSFGQLHQALSKLVGLVEDTDPEADKKSIFLLRILRETRQQLPRLGIKTSAIQAAQPFSSDIIEPLHRKLAQKVATTPVESYKSSLSRTLKSKKCPGRALWEGTPSLPIRPSPKAFKFLGNLTQSMADAGGDVWAPGAVRTFKAVLRVEARTLLQATITQLLAGEQPPTNGTGTAHDITQQDATASQQQEGNDKDASSSKEDHAARRDNVIQLLFDLAYLQCAFNQPGESADISLVEPAQLRDELQLDAAALTHLQESSKEYWKKTYLLFALLS